MAKSSTFIIYLFVEFKSKNIESRNLGVSNANKIYLKKDKDPRLMNKEEFKTLVKDFRAVSMIIAHILMKGKGERKEVYYNSYIYEGVKVRNSKILTGFFALSEEEQRKTRSKNGKKISKKIMEEKIGIFSQTDEERKKICSLGGKAVKELKIGIFGMSKEEKSNHSRKAVAITNAQRWICLESGFVSTSGGLSAYQKARGIDTSKRERIL